MVTILLSLGLKCIDLKSDKNSLMSNHDLEKSLTVWPDKLIKRSIGGFYIVQPKAYVIIHWRERVFHKLI